VGGYEDWLRQRATGNDGLTQTTSKGPAASDPSAVSALLGAEAEASAKAARRTGKKKLSFKERREMEELPRHIEQLEAEQEGLRARIASPEFYKESSDTIARALARIDELKDSLHDAYARWDELDSRTKA
jgi:ATP-binding cassette subfamily F protein uup